MCVSVFPYFPIDQSVNQIIPPIVDLSHQPRPLPIPVPPPPPFQSRSRPSSCPSADQSRQTEQIRPVRPGPNPPKQKTCCTCLLLPIAAPLSEIFSRGLLSIHSTQRARTDGHGHAPHTQTHRHAFTPRLVHVHTRPHTLVVSHSLLTLIRSYAPTSRPPSERTNLTPIPLGREQTRTLGITTPFR